MRLFKKATFRISMSPSDVRDRTGYSDGVMTIHKKYNEWTVSHLLSGREIASRSKLSDAKKLAIELQAVSGVDWSLDDPGKSLSGSVEREIKALVYPKVEELK